MTKSEFEILRTKYGLPSRKFGRIEGRGRRLDDLAEEIRFLANNGFPRESIIIGETEIVAECDWDFDNPLHELEILKKIEYVKKKEPWHDDPNYDQVTGRRLWSRIELGRVAFENSDPGNAGVTWEELEEWQRDEYGQFGAAVAKHVGAKVEE